MSSLANKKLLALCLREMFFFSLPNLIWKTKDGAGEAITSEGTDIKLKKQTNQNPLEFIRLDTAPLEQQEPMNRNCMVSGEEFLCKSLPWKSNLKRWVWPSDFAHFIAVSPFFNFSGKKAVIGSLAYLQILHMEQVQSPLLPRCCNIWEHLPRNQVTHWPPLGTTNW